MALLVDEKNVPEIGDKVSKVEVSNAGGDKAAWITFESGKTVIAHLCDSEPLPAA